ncbi:MAG: TraR/DksA C4-type zinc finger protein [Rhizobiaceae bacterium]|nr:TraR/DksA C4-type zinc finger protein [Rhizobiaceae bacterium]
MTNTEYYRKKLRDRRAELETMIAKIEDLLDDPLPASFSEQAMELEDDEVLEIRGRHEHEELKAIDAALSRIDNDVFGTCISCQNGISDERLEAVPYATLCRNCMSVQI